LGSALGQMFPYVLVLESFFNEIRGWSSAGDIHELHELAL
jgi:hypothetical protein